MPCFTMFASIILSNFQGYLFIYAYESEVDFQEKETYSESPISALCDF